MGDLLRAEAELPTKEGERLKKTIADGGMVPSDTTISILTAGITANPAPAYLVEGFPRSIDQAQSFEQTVMEAQQILFLDLDNELMIDRCAKRAETSERADDTADTLKKRVTNYQETTLPVIEYYEKFAKVRTVNASRADAGEIYKDVKEAILPQVMFMLGPKASGKSRVADDIAQRSNMRHIKFDEYLKTNNLTECDDEAVCMHLIQNLACEQLPRVILEDFPQNLFQAKFFLRNCKAPSNVFSLQCSKDACQERMLALGETHPEYVSSGILSQKIKDYNTAAKDLLPFLKAQVGAAFAEVNTERLFAQAIADVRKHYEPCVIHIRPGPDTNDLKKEITEQLSTNHGFVNLDINSLIRYETERRTAIGQEMHSMVQGSKIIPAEMIVRMLKLIVYNGQPKMNKFILTSFPDIIEQANEFESQCARITAIIYTTRSEGVVEIKNNSLSLFNIDSLFQKEFRLKTMDTWDPALFEEKLGNKTEFGLVLGQTLSGKTELANYLSKSMGMQLIDLNAVNEKVKKSLGTEDEPYEGDLAPLDAIEADVAATVKACTAGGARAKFVFDGFATTHKTPAAVMALVGKFGVPEFVLNLTATKETIGARFCAKNEKDAVGEDDEAELAGYVEADTALRGPLVEHFKKFPGRCTIYDLSTDTSLETTTAALRQLFQPKIILLNHEKRLGTDTTCSNLAIKYNLIYLSVYQIIKQHIEANTEWGERLKLTKREKALNVMTQVRDEFAESDYSPALFDQNLVMALLKHTIAEKRTDERFVLLEGLFNNSKLQNEDDKLEVRLMDEFFAIESQLGEVAACISLQFLMEPTEEKDVVYEKQDDKAGDEKPAEAAPEEPPADGEEGGEAKAPVWKASDYQWTITNRKPKNLPQVYLRCKGVDKTKHEVKTADSFSTSSYEAISKSLDEFCAAIKKEDESKSKGEEWFYLYQQVVFND